MDSNFQILVLCLMLEMSIIKILNKIDSNVHILYKMESIVV